jgi:hypothetical protein
MENPLKEQIKSLLNSEVWLEIERLLKEPIEDYVEGSYADIAIHLLAKKKAESHINFTLNKLKVLYGGREIKPINYK